MINILDTPEKFQPVYSDGLFFTISADTTDTYKFRFTYELYVEDTLVFEGKASPNPYNLGVIDVSRIVKTYTENNPIALWNTTPIYVHQTFPFSRPYQNETINYYLKFGYEYSDTANGTITGFTGNGEVGTPGVESELYKTFYSTMGVNGRATQQDFDMGPFILSGAPIGQYPTTSGLFLTNSPRIRNIQPTEYYTLGFTNYYLSENQLSEPYYVEYNFYDDQGTLIDTHQYQNITTNGGGPLEDCSFVYPSFYNQVTTGNTDYNTLYVGAGPLNISGFPANCAQYTVQLFGKFSGETSPPTPTPTPTLTPSPTAGCSLCYTYEITNPSLTTPCIVYYTECSYGPTRVVTIDPQESLVICSCRDALIYECALDVNIIGLCGGQLSSPTPTPTYTPSPTPYCECVEYGLENENPFLSSYSYTDCTGNPQSGSIPAFNAIAFCACIGSVTADAGVVISELGACPAPTPTATGTPTPTPTPSNSCAPIEWFINECTATCSGGICACESSFVTAVWTDCTVTNITDPGTAIYSTSALTTPWTGDFVDFTTIYNSTGSDVVYVCTIGGPC